jgi:hypothetical protein
MFMNKAVFHFIPEAFFDTILSIFMAAPTYF